MPDIPLGIVVGPQGPKGDKGDTGTFSPEDLQRITNLESGKVDKVAGKGLSTNDYTNADKNAVATIENKVDKVTGKGLSTNDYTTAEKNKLSGIPADANKTIIDATLSNAGQAADAKAAGDALAALRNYIASMDVSRVASGNPATFSDAKAANVRDLTVTITPTQSGSGNPSPDNVRPISGVSSVSVTRAGKNLLPNYAYSKTENDVVWTVNPDGTVVAQVPDTPRSSTSQMTVANSIPLYRAGLAVGTTYIFSGCPAGGGASGGYWARIYSKNKTGGVISIFQDDGDGVSFTPTDEWANVTAFLHCQPSLVSKTLAFAPMVRRVSEPDAAYEPYQGQTVTVTLTDGSNPLTVYGGTLDVTTGTLTVTWANIASYNGETLPGRWISDRDVYAPGTTPTTGAQVVYELATPATYQLTPQQLTTLSGYNAVSSDAGAVDVTYKADTTIVFGGG